MRCFRRRLAWLGDQAGWFMGIVACVLLMVVLVPLEPLFSMYAEIRELYEDD